MGDKSTFVDLSRQQSWLPPRLHMFSVGPMGLGTNIAALRKRKSWTLDDLEEKSGVGRAVIHALESRGSRASKHAPALASALGVSVDELLADHVPPAPNIPDVTVSEWRPEDAGLQPIGKVFTDLGSVLAGSNVATRKAILALLESITRDPESAPEVAAQAEALLRAGKRRAA